MKVLLILGTRPEAVKLCPVICCMKSLAPEFEVRVCLTAQHREMLDEVMATFAVAADYDLNVMQQGQTLWQSTARIIAGLERVIKEEAPGIVLVQGDTTTAFCGALCAFYGGVPVGHVEAGLRTNDMGRPFPEEMNRVLTARLTQLHFAPTESAAANLVGEGVPSDTIHVTGNTAIDALVRVRDGLKNGTLRGLNGDLPLDSRKKLIVVTAHRRENFGAGIERICDALVRLSDRGDAQIVYPVHPNPNVDRPVRRRLSNRRNILLLEPLSYVPFIDLMGRADILLTDSGGVQEEGPALGKPVLVMRDTTERTEGVGTAAATLVGTDPDSIVRHTERLLASYLAAVPTALYGDGHASDRIAAIIAKTIGRQRACRQ